MQICINPFLFAISAGIEFTAIYIKDKNQPITVIIIIVFLKDICLLFCLRKLCSKYWFKSRLLKQMWYRLHCSHAQFLSVALRQIVDRLGSSGPRYDIRVWQWVRVFVSKTRVRIRLTDAKNAVEEKLVTGSVIRAFSRFVTQCVLTLYLLGRQRSHAKVCPQNGVFWNYIQFSFFAGEELPQHVSS